MALFETGDGDPAARRAGRRRSCRVDRRPTEDELADLDQGRCPHQPLHLGVVAGRRARARPAGGARAGPPAGPTRSRPSARSPTRSASPVAGARGAPRRRGTRAAAPSLSRGRRGARPRRRAAPAGLHGATACPPRTAAAEIDLDRADGPAPGRACPAPSFSTYPVAKEDVALVVDDAVPAAEVEAALREGAGELLESIRLFDVYTGDQVGAGQEVAGLRAALPGPRPDAHRVEETAAARDAAVASAAAACGAVQRA